MIELLYYDGPGKDGYSKPIRREKHLVVLWLEQPVSLLKSHQLPRAPVGLPCPICGKPCNGGPNKNDNIYEWSASLGHFIKEHDMALPDAFIEHVLSCMRRPK